MEATSNVSAAPSGQLLPVGPAACSEARPLALPEEFMWELKDDALAPTYPRGLEIIWSTTKVAVVGSLLLVRLSDGSIHARVKAQDRPTSGWLASAIHPEFATFDPRETQMEILAVGKQSIHNIYLEEGQA